MILLLNPPNPPGTVSNKDMMGGFGQLYPAGIPVKVPPLDLVYSAAVLKKENIEFEVLDCLGLEADLPLLEEKIVSKKYEYVFIRTSTATFSFDLEAGALLKSVTGAKIVFFGPHTGVFPGEVLKNAAVDAVITGEPENTIKNIALSGFKGVKGVWYKDKSEIIANEPAENLEELDSLPFPAWEYFPYKKYNIDDLLTGEGNTSFVLTSRGCPFNCDYCPYPVAQGTVYRKRSALNVIEEIKYLYEKFGVRKILFRDAEFTLDREKVLEICAGIRNLNIKWRCETRIDTLDEELVIAMSLAGCTGINMGIESGSDKIIKASGRKIMDKIQTGKILARCRDLGVHSFCFFIIGLPGEDLATVVETMEFAESIKPDICQFTVATPYPGTRLFAHAVKNNYIVKYQDDKITGYEALMRNETFTAPQISGLRNAIQLRFNTPDEIKAGNKEELQAGSVLAGIFLGSYNGRSGKRIVVYGARGVPFEKLKARGYQILGITDERYFGEKVGGFTVLHPVIIPVFKPDAVLISPLKRSSNIKEYTAGTTVIEPLAFLKEIIIKLKG